MSNEQNLNPYDAVTIAVAEGRLTPEQGAMMMNVHARANERLMMTRTHHVTLSHAEEADNVTTH